MKIISTPLSKQLYQPPEEKLALAAAFQDWREEEAADHLARVRATAKENAKHDAIIMGRGIE